MDLQVSTIKSIAYYTLTFTDNSDKRLESGIPRP